MAENLFSDPEIHRQIEANILRLKAKSLEWDENPDGRSFDDFIVETLVQGLDAHAEAYLCKVDREDLIGRYVDYLRDVGAAQVANAEQRSHLKDPYSEDRLRKMAENTGSIINRRHELTPEQYEADVRAEVERCRSYSMPDATRWNEWYCQILIRVERLFEARYRHWAAEAIERVQRESKARASKPADPSLIGRLGGKGKNPEPQFPKRASWLRDRLLERGWSNSDPSKYRGPDRKTIDKILRCEAVRNDVLEKLADALSSKPPKVNVLDIPQD